MQKALGSFYNTKAKLKLKAKKNHKPPVIDNYLHVWQKKIFEEIFKKKPN